MRGHGSRTHLGFNLAEGGRGLEQKLLLRDTAAMGATGLVMGNCSVVGESPEWVPGVPG